jgi:sec-independent protein translocase protein TatB
MLPGLGFQEILLLGVIALIVIKPQDLPGLFRELGRFTRKMQGMAAEFRQGFDELARQAELDELRREVETLKTAATIPDLEAAMLASGESPPTTVLAPEGTDSIIPDDEPQPAPEFSPEFSPDFTAAPVEDVVPAPAITPSKAEAS